MVTDENGTQVAGNASCSSNATESDMDCIGNINVVYSCTYNCNGQNCYMKLYRCLEPR